MGGSKTSAHMIGYAVDLFPMNGEFGRFAEFVQQYLDDKDFDQCIIEQSEFSHWLHLGLRNTKNRQRKQTFRMNM